VKSKGQNHECGWLGHGNRTTQRSGSGKEKQSLRDLHARKASTAKREQTSVKLSQMTGRSFIWKTKDKAKNGHTFHKWYNTIYKKNTLVKGLTW